jgi:hypothetical protein
MTARHVALRAALLSLSLAASGPAAPAGAQSRYLPTGLSVRAGLGVDGHGVGDLARWQRAEQAAVADAGVALAETAAFPAFPSVRVEVGYLGARWNRRRDIRYEVGVAAGLGMTGGRLYYADYSGAFAVDRRARRLALGVYAEHEAARWERAWVGLRLDLRASPTWVGYRRAVAVGEETVEAADVTFRAVPVGVEPAVLAETAVSDRLGLRARLGYELSTRPALGAADGLPEGAGWAGDGPAVGWSGLRLGVGLAARLGGDGR